ncbi:hypothetical protein IV203_027454 [Nitzschia inconspicua]|uniref:Hexosyltransferase n=1 Tax=Nitzschia inconspicua TaxID=303405 RepID=A0A9K3LXA9_9STRA|nr:hypothetical protein IV203_027454 [Nitzschia inconspicua]
MFPFFELSTKSLQSMLQSVILLVAASFLMIHERRTSRVMKSEIELATYSWSGEWKINTTNSDLVKQQARATISNKLNSHLPPEHPQPGPKILWGITSSYGSDMELRRREVIRSTYLSYCKNNDHFVGNSDRICSLADIIEQKVHFDRCQLAYTFVVGGNPDGTEELIDPQAPSRDYLADRTKITNAERDATYLNIKENQFGGKIQTWFAYTSSLIKEGYAFDYVVKADRDTMLCPEEFFSEVSISLPTSPTRIYAGVAVSRYHCGKKKDEHCDRMVSDYYMGGAAEIVSSDLVHHLASLPAERRHQLVVTSHEDITIGNFLLSHPDAVTKIELGKPWGYKVRRRRLWVPVIQFAIKSACACNRKDVVEYCAMRSSSGKMELYLSRLTTHVMSVNEIDGNTSLTFQVDQIEMFDYPEYDRATDEEEAQENQKVIGDEAKKEEEQTPDEKIKEGNTVKDADLQPWRENVVVVVRNPIDDHFKEWFKVIQPNEPVDEMAIRSKNVEALQQLQKSDVKNVYAVRLEHLWDDIVSLERTFGNPNPIDRSMWPALADPIVHAMSHSSNEQVMSRKMCCILRHEVFAYHELLLLSQNLEGPNVQSPQTFGNTARAWNNRPK